LRVSEDAYNGDAQFIARVDGTQLGGIQTAYVLHSSDDANIFTFAGNWSASATHQVQIQFVNDAYGGSPTMDRNLYVNSIAFNGVTEAATAASLFSNETSNFTVGGTTAAADGPADTLTVHLAEDA
jgi:Ca-dependent carbohydrate-binding module xylan-binding